MRPFNSNITTPNIEQKSLWQKVHIDLPLLFGILLIMIMGFIILYSASNDSDTLIRQGIRFTIALLVMFIVAQIPPHTYRYWSPWLFALGTLLLFAVLIMGSIGKGAQRWLDLGLFRFQPAELMKIAVPLMLAWYLKDQPLRLPLKVIFNAILLITIPFLLVAKQPDLGTAILIAAAGFGVLFLANISWRFLISTITLIAASLPIIWNFLHPYQQQRVLTFLNPEQDPLGSGYHIIQSKIAIGSGGLFGKGWLNGSQSQLQFLPEHTTDFIFAVCAEEFGLIGAFTLILVYLFIIGRGIYISLQAQDTFSRLLAGSLSIAFFTSVFVNIGMVIGLLPVVGLPLPLISYGGTSMVTTMAGFGLLMSIQTHRKLLAT